MKAIGEWVNTLWCQADRFLSWKSFGLYSPFELWLISEGALHTPVCRTAQQICTRLPGTGMGTLPSCLQHTELCSIQSWFTHSSGPADNFWVSWKSLKLGYKEHLIYWRPSLRDEGLFSNSQQILTYTDLATKVTVYPIALQRGDSQRSEGKTREYHDNFFPGGLPWKQHFKIEQGRLDIRRSNHKPVCDGFSITFPTKSVLSLQENKDKKRGQGT